MVIIGAIFFAVAVFLGYAILRSLVSVAPYVPMDKADLEMINDLARLESGHSFCELGSGDGRVSYFIASKNPRASVLGVEIFLPVFLWSKTKSFLDGNPKNLKFELGDALKKNLSNHDVVYVYALATTISGHLKEKFEKELKKGARIISYSFSIKGWKGRSWEYMSADGRTAIYVYEK